MKIHLQSIQAHRSRRGFLRLNVTIWLAILVMSVAGVVATCLYHLRNPTHSSPLEIADSPTDTKKTIEKTNYTPNILNITEQCKKMVSNENSFVIFEHGTCVRLLEPISDHSESACSSLKILSSPNLSFTIKPLNNSNYLIVFNDYLFCWLFAKDIANMKDALLTDPRLASSQDDPSSIKDIPNFEKRLGKFARILMMKDSKTLTVKKIIRAKN